MELTITPVAEPDELFCHYPGQYSPQPVVLALSLKDGTLGCHYNPNVGGNAMPMSVWHQRTLWFTIPTLTGSAANALMDRVAPLAREILADCEIVWDGNNHVGQLGPRAICAEGEINVLCKEEFDPSELVGEMTAEDWWIDGRQSAIDVLGLTADTTDEQIAAMADEQVTAAREGGEGYTILTGAREYLTAIRDDLVWDRSEMDRWDVVTKHESIGYSAEDTGLALQRDGVWEHDVPTAADAVALVARETGIDKDRIRVVASTNPVTAEPCWEVALS